MTDDVDALRKQNERLGEQVKLLVRTERRLHQTQRNLEDQIRQVNALNEFSLKTARLSSVEEIVREGQELLLRIYPFHRALAVLVDPDEDRTLRFDRRPRSGVDDIDRDLDELDADLLASLESEPTFLDEPTALAEHESAALRRLLDVILPDDGAYDNWHSALLLPLTNAGETPFGLLWAINCCEHLSSHQFGIDSDDQPMVEVFRRHLSVAADNARLHSRLEQRVRRRTEELARTLDELEETNQRLQREMNERLQAERTLARVQKLESLGELTASLGHEINNPLGYLTANLQFVQQQFEQRLDDDQTSPPELLEAVDDALDGAERIAQLVDDMKAFSLDEDLTATAVDPTAVVEKAVRLVENKLVHIADFDVALPDNLPAIEGHEGPLEQVLVNLLLNAMDAVDIADTPDPSIRVDAERIDDEWMELAVHDNGCGIDSDEMAKVFDPFYTTKFARGGTGLGLFVCHTLVESMNGSIHLDSSPGEGTTVMVHLRVASRGGDTDVELPRDAETPRADTRRILVVDDEEPVLRALRRILHDHDIHTTTSGAEAVAMYRNDSFDLVVCDLSMPGMSGRDVYEHLRDIGAEDAGRIIFITGGAFNDAARKFLDDVPNPCLRKPFDRSELQHLIRQLS